MKQLIYLLGAAALISLFLPGCRKDLDLEPDGNLVRVNLKGGSQGASPRTPIHVNGTTLYDSRGNSFIMRGINLPFVWYPDEVLDNMDAIAATGANSVRIVLNNTGEQKVKEILDLCYQHKLIAILESHNTTTKDELTDLEFAVNYWIGMSGLLIGREDLVIINIANEWLTQYSDDEWTTGYSAAIKKIRKAGLTHCLMIDVSGYGQKGRIISHRGQEVFDADDLHNVIFSIHMYEEAGNTRDDIHKNIDDCLAKGFALCIGEFGWKHNGKEVDEDFIMEFCAVRGVGWLAWSWKGNTGSVEYLDMSQEWDGSVLTPWGDSVVNGIYGLKNMSKMATTFIPVDIPFKYWRQRGPLQLQMTMRDDYALYARSNLKINDGAKIFNSDATDYYSVGGGIVTTTSIPDIDYKDLIYNNHVELGQKTIAKNVVSNLKNGVNLREPYVTGDVLALYKINGRARYPFFGHHLANLIDAQEDIGEFNVYVNRDDLFYVDESLDIRVEATSPDKMNPYNIYPKEYGEINIGSGNMVVFQGEGQYYCEKLYIEPNVLLVFPENKSVEIYVKGEINIKWGTKMVSFVDDKIVGANPEHILMVSNAQYDQNGIYLAPHINWRGTLVAPDARINICANEGELEDGELNDEPNPLCYQEMSDNGELFGSIYGREIEVHQRTSFYHVFYKHWNEGLE